MKNLFLVRHAKSSHADAHIQDIDRPLNARGYSDAASMAKMIHEKKIYPDLIFSSPAVRALTTAKIFADELKYSADSILIDPVLYSFNADLILSAILGMKNEIESAMLFSHNPTFHELANYFSRNKIPIMPTCCIVGISFEADKWDEADECKRNLFLYEYPKKISADAE